MREILFRAKWMHNKEWIEGYYCKISETTYAFAEDYDKYPVPVHHYILQESMTDWGLPNRFRQYEIDPETLCQYTGLKDKNGKKIWENDIVSCEHEKFQESDDVEQHLFSDTIKYNRNYAVEFINTGSNYGCRLRNKSIHFNLTGNTIYNHNVEVIGNIFDSPELLKED